MHDTKIVCSVVLIFTELCKAVKFEITQEINKIHKNVFPVLIIRRLFGVKVLTCTKRSL